MSESTSMHPLWRVKIDQRTRQRNHNLSVRAKSEAFVVRLCWTVIKLILTIIKIHCSIPGIHSILSVNPRWTVLGDALPDQWPRRGLVVSANQVERASLGSGHLYPHRGRWTPWIIRSEDRTASFSGNSRWFSRSALGFAQQRLAITSNHRPVIGWLMKINEKVKIA